MMGLFDWLKKKRKNEGVYPRAGISATIREKQSKKEKRKEKEPKTNKEPKTGYSYPKYHDSSRSSYHVCAFCGKEIRGTPKVKNHHWWLGNVLKQLYIRRRKKAQQQKSKDECFGLKNTEKNKTVKEKKQ